MTPSVSRTIVLRNLRARLEVCPPEARFSALRAEAAKDVGLFDDVWNVVREALDLADVCHCGEPQAGEHDSHGFTRMGDVLDVIDYLLEREAAT